MDIEDDEPADGIEPNKLPLRTVRESGLVYKIREIDDSFPF